MKPFSEILNETQGPALFFMGQAGLILKTASGTTLGIDLYLSNCCERYVGFKRLMPYLLLPEDHAFDFLITTHAHYDHFDFDAMPTLLAPEKTQLFAARDCARPLAELGLSEEKVCYIERGGRYTLADITLEAVECDHGKTKPEAVGLLLHFDNKTVYVAGDTAPLPALAQQLSQQAIDAAVLPINGAFGNLNETQAAEILAILQPRLAIPCHYWNFGEHGGNPYRFTEEAKRLCPAVKTLPMRPGEVYLFEDADQ